ncbi:UbiX family flavin prenyltransferase [Brenneria goodwinii]|uniref:Flavin prenyltransferase UbiX n=1 Tax=Brenneria goodwinii TaxID=1109412 RepID=A0A0G4JQK7_9GAMM|nr:UbiX family flavin prenyltransferase [Brenneria goodwinii]MCG8157952.1 UbiX family flavin prenyltransferase [Brenneria goodwinii]MCG8162544.1 UbiX family flavin prenyltransferase [Brenneria goodwinii]MCG8166585.1 UbiX family flavin prenyltransferase [Brenneria goodwinii]MCG8172506.1 UbiX family flavin prenyltransferase [Brenneria goodwinii]MCG8175655.1 UbiX family flavin prenyltransferase [Brenneria goodwinii]
MTTQRIIIGISGASGFQYGVKALELLQGKGLEVHLVVSKGAEKTCQLETDYRLDEVMAMADVVHPIGNLGASLSSGSFKTLGMLVAPCSMRTLAAIAYCLTDNLLTRAADVVLKERRKLVLLARETPLNLGHIRNMQAVTEMGGIIFPPVPALYQRPQSLDEIVSHSVIRALDLFGLEVDNMPRWGEGKLVYTA